MYALSSYVLQALLASPSLVPELDALHKSGSRIHPFIRLLTDTLVKQLLAGVEASAETLDDLAAAGLLQQEAQAVAARLLAGCCAPAAPSQPQQGSASGKKAKKADAVAGPSAEVKAAAKKLLCTLERRHPQGVDAAINAALGTASEGKQQQAAGPSPQQRKAIYDFVNEALAGTAHALCGSSGFTLAAALTAPQAGMRRTALQQADELLNAAGLSEEAKSELQVRAQVARGAMHRIGLQIAYAMRHLSAEGAQAL